MNRNGWLTIMVLMFCFVMSTDAWAVSVPGRTSRQVNDYANVLRPEAAEEFERVLQNFKKENPKLEVTLTTIASLDGMETAEFMDEYVLRWRRWFGFREEERVHIVYFMKERRIRLGISTKLDHVLSHADASDIVQEVAGDYFALGDSEGGMRSLISIIAYRLSQSSTTTSRTQA